MTSEALFKRVAPRAAFNVSADCLPGLLGSTRKEASAVSLQHFKLNRIRSGHRDSIADFTRCIAASPTLWSTSRAPARVASGLDRLIMLAATLAVTWVTSTHLAQGQGVMQVRAGSR